MRRPHPLAAIRDDGDRQSLTAERLDSLDAVWHKIGKEGNQSRGVLRRDPNRRVRLVGDLIEAARQEAEAGPGSRLGRHWLDLLLCLAVLGVLVLGVRAFFKAGSVAIALRDLRAGEQLKAEALHGADNLELPDGRRRGPDLRLNVDIPEGGYIPQEALERREVVALRDIRTGSVIPMDAVRQEWKHYEREPAAFLEQVVGNRAAQDIPKGTTLRPNQVESESVLVKQVVAIRLLPRFHRITAADLRLEQRPRQAGALLLPAEAIGRYPLQEIEEGATLTRKVLSPGTLGRKDSSDRQLLTIRVEPPSFRLIPQLPARVSLAVSVQGGSRNLLLRDVLVLAVEQGKDGPALVIALTETDLEKLLPLLPDAQIFVLQPSP